MDTRSPIRRRKVEEISVLLLALRAEHREKALQALAALVGEEAMFERERVVQDAVDADAVPRTNGASLGVVTPVDDANDPCVDEGAGAHRAGLERDVEGGAGQTVVRHPRGGRAPRS